MIRWTAPPLHFHFKLRPLVRNQKKWRVHPIINFVTPPYTRFIRILLCPSHLHLRRCLSLCMHVPQVGWLAGWSILIENRHRGSERWVGMEKLIHGPLPAKHADWTGDCNRVASYSPPPPPPPTLATQLLLARAENRAKQLSDTE